MIAHQIFSPLLHRNQANNEYKKKVLSHDWLHLIIIATFGKCLLPYIRLTIHHIMHESSNAVYIVY